MKICFDKDDNECATAFTFDDEEGNGISSCNDMISWLSENDIDYNKFRLTKNSPYCLVVNRNCNKTYRNIVCDFNHEKVHQKTDMIGVDEISRDIGEEVVEQSTVNLNLDGNLDGNSDVNSDVNSDSKKKKEKKKTKV
jgi:hypothetical protein